MTQYNSYNSRHLEFGYLDHWLKRYAGIKFSCHFIFPMVVRARVACANGPRVSTAKPRIATHRNKLDSDKLGDATARPNR